MQSVTLPLTETTEMPMGKGSWGMSRDIEKLERVEQI